MTAIEMRKVSKRFHRTAVIREVDLHVEPGDFCVFVGPSGCGKSTLLRLVAGLEDVSSGDLLIDGERVNDRPPVERGVAMVFQSYALYPHMTVRQNLAFGLKLARSSPETIAGRVAEAARMLQIGDLLDRLPRQLSGGQRQRVAIGRAIVRHPRVFLFDEPLSNLDAALRVQTRMEIARLHQRLGTTMIYVTHDQVEAMTLATRIVVLRDGRVEQVGAPLVVYHHPRNTFVAGFIGSPKMNMLAGTLLEARADGARVRLEGGQELSAAVAAEGAGQGAVARLGVRPEHLVPGGAEGAGLAGRVAYQEHLGNHSLAYLDVPGQEELLTVQLAAEHRVREGEALTVGVPPEACHLFDQDGRACRRLVSPAGVAPPDAPA